jgi:hypothetical protein
MAELPRAELPPTVDGVLGGGPGKPHGFVTTLGVVYGERVELTPTFRDLAWVACGSCWVMGHRAGQLPLCLGHLQASTPACLRP